MKTPTHPHKLRAAWACAAFAVAVLGLWSASAQDGTTPAPPVAPTRGAQPDETPAPPETGGKPDLPVHKPSYHTDTSTVEESRKLPPTAPTAPAPTAPAPTAEPSLPEDVIEQETFTTEDSMAQEFSHDADHGEN